MMLGAETILGLVLGGIPLAIAARDQLRSPGLRARLTCPIPPIVPSKKGLNLLSGELSETEYRINFYLISNVFPLI